MTRRRTRSPVRDRGASKPSIPASVMKTFEALAIQAVALASYVVKAVTTRSMMKRFNEQLGTRPLSDLPVEVWRAGATAFILGSGPSINGMSDDQWRHVRQGTSIGFNWWLHHPHVPDLYVFEDALETHRDTLQQRADAYASVPVILKHLVCGFTADPQAEQLELLRDYPPEVLAHTYLSSELPLRGNSPLQLRHALRLAAWLGLFRTSRRVQWLPIRSSSLTYLIALCVRAGFDEIVLCGVDLNRPGTFYSTPEELEAGIDPAGRDGRATPIHETEDPSYKSLPISTILSVLDQQVLHPRGIQLWVAHPGSALAGVLPVYAWEDSARPMQAGGR